MQRFVREASVIYIYEYDLAYASCAYMSPTDALDYAVKEYKLGNNSIGFYIGNQSALAKDFVTRGHAFEWLNEVQLYGIVRDKWHG